MPTRYVTPYAREFADDGLEVGAGYKLNFYAAGTTTRQDTYSDIEYAVPNENPVVADSDGRFPDIWMVGSYKVILTDADGVQIWSADNVSGSGGAGDAGVFDTAQDLRDFGYSSWATTARTLGAASADDNGGGSWRWDADSTDDDNLGTVLLPTGHVGAGRWVRELKGYVAPEFFTGASDTATWNALAAYCADHPRTRVLTSGSYTISGQISFDGCEKLTIEGSGTLTADAAKVADPIIALTNCTGLTIRGITIDGNSARESLNPDDGEIGGTSLASNVNLQVSVSTDILIEGVISVDAVDAGILVVDDCHGIRIIGCVVTNSGANNIICHSDVTDIVIANNICDYSRQQNNIFLATMISGDGDAPVVNAVIEGNVCLNAKDIGIEVGHIITEADSLHDGISITGNVVRLSGNSGILVRTGKNISIVGNTIIEAGQLESTVEVDLRSALRVTGDNFECEDVLIRDNLVNLNFASVNTGFRGISVNGANRFVIGGNTIMMHTSTTVDAMHINSSYQAAGTFNGHAGLTRRLVRNFSITGNVCINAGIATSPFAHASFPSNFVRIRENHIYGKDRELDKGINVANATSSGLADTTKLVEVSDNHIEWVDESKGGISLTIDADQYVARGNILRNTHRIKVNGEHAGSAAGQASLLLSRNVYLDLAGSNTLDIQNVDYLAPLEDAENYSQHREFFWVTALEPAASENVVITPSFPISTSNARAFEVTYICRDAGNTAAVSNQFLAAIRSDSDVWTLSVGSIELKAGGGLAESSITYTPTIDSSTGVVTIAVENTGAANKTATIQVASLGTTGPF